MRRSCYVSHIVCCTLQLSVGVKQTQRELFGKDVNGLWTASNDPSKSITISDGDAADGPKKCRIELTGPTPKGSSAPASRTVAVDWAPIDFNPKTLTVAYKGKSGVYELGVWSDGSAVRFYATYEHAGNAKLRAVRGVAVPCAVVGTGSTLCTVAGGTMQGCATQKKRLKRLCSLPCCMLPVVGNAAHGLSPASCPS
jgi:hypothetical protein